MNHKTKILADRYFAVPTAFALNAVARLLGFVLRREHSVKSDNVKTIVVAKLIGMGSILQAKPLLVSLRERYPDAKLIFVTLRSNRELLRRIQSVDEIVTLDDRSVLALAASTLQALVTLISRRADLYFDLEVYSGFASVLALCSVTRNRLGFYRHSVAFKKGIYTHLVYFNTRMPVRQLYLQLGRVAGVASGQTSLTGPILVHDHERVAVRVLLSTTPGWQANEPYVVLNPNASDLLLERRWPVESAIEAIERLVSSGRQVALVGAPNEAQFVKSLFDRLAPATQYRVANTAGRLQLGELLALLEGAACIVTNDTGPMHMAIALGRPTVCLFGPANPEHYGHNLPYVETFYARVFCSPCIYEADEPPCNGNNICMERIKPEAVVNVVHRFLRGDFAANDSRGCGHTSDLPVMVDAPNGSPLGVVLRVSLEQAKEVVTHDVDPSDRPKSTENDPVPTSK